MDEEKKENTVEMIQALGAASFGCFSLILICGVPIILAIRILVWLVESIF